MLREESIVHCVLASDTGTAELQQRRLISGGRHTFQMPSSWTLLGRRRPVQSLLEVHLPAECPGLGFRDTAGAQRKRYQYIGAIEQANGGRKSTGSSIGEEKLEHL